MSQPAPESPAPEGPEGPSQPFGAVLFIFFIFIVVGYNGRDSWWGIIPHLLALGFLSFGAWQAYNPGTVADILQKYPRETREHWRLNSLLCMVVFPGVLWLLLGLPFLVLWRKR